MVAVFAIGHIIGTIVVLFLLGIGILMFAGWEGERNQKTALQEASLALGISVSDLENADHHEKIFRFAAEKFSSELFINRLSDLCGWVQTGWGWVSNLVQVGLLLGVIWYTVTDDPSNGANAWWVVAVALFFWISSLVFGYACKLLTGRFPGQAKQARKLLTVEVEKERKTERTL